MSQLQDLIDRHAAVKQSRDAALANLNRTAGAADSLVGDAIELADNQSGIALAHHQRAERLAAEVERLKASVGTGPTDPDPDPIDPVEPGTGEPGMVDLADLSEASFEELKAHARRHGPTDADRALRSGPHNSTYIQLGAGSPVEVNGSVHRVVDAEFSPQWAWALNMPRPSQEVLTAATGDLEIRNCGMRERRPGTSPVYWFLRAYNVGDFVMRDCDIVGQLIFDDNGDVIAVWPKEHGAYVSNVGSTHVENCLFDNVGSQGLQAAHRENDYQQYKEDNAPYAANPVHRLLRTGFIDLGLGGRPGFAATYFDAGTNKFPGTLEIDQMDYVCLWDKFKGPDGTFADHQATPYHQRAEGALMLSSYDLAHEVAEHGVRGDTMDLVKVTRSTFARGESRKELISLRGAKHVVFEDCYFRGLGGLDELRVDSLPELRELGAAADTVTFRRCWSDGVTAAAFTDSNIVRASLHCPDSAVRWEVGSNRFVSIEG